MCIIKDLYADSRKKEKNRQHILSIAIICPIHRYSSTTGKQNALHILLCIKTTAPILVAETGDDLSPPNNKKKWN